MSNSISMVQVAYNNLEQFYTQQKFLDKFLDNTELHRYIVDNCPSKDDSKLLFKFCNSHNVEYIPYKRAVTYKDDPSFDHCTALNYGIHRYAKKIAETSILWICDPDLYLINKLSWSDLTFTYMNSVDFFGHFRDNGWDSKNPKDPKYYPSVINFFFKNLLYTDLIRFDCTPRSEWGDSGWNLLNLLPYTDKDKLKPIMDKLPCRVLDVPELEGLDVESVKRIQLQGDLFLHGYDSSNWSKDNSDNVKKKNNYVQELLDLAYHDQFDKVKERFTDVDHY